MQVKKTKTWIHEENADIDTWKIHSFNTIPFPFPFPFPSKYSLVGCHGDGGTVSRNNVRTTIFHIYCWNIKNVFTRLKQQQAGIQNKFIHQLQFPRPANSPNSFRSIDSVSVWVPLRFPFPCHNTPGRGYLFSTFLLILLQPTSALKGERIVKSDRSHRHWIQWNNRGKKTKIIFFNAFHRTCISNSMDSWTIFPTWFVRID